MQKQTTVVTWHTRMEAAWRSLRRNARLLRAQESEAFGDYESGLRTRLAVAAQAADLPTLVRDQIELNASSRARILRHLRARYALVRRQLQEWRRILLNGLWSSAR